MRTIGLSPKVTLPAAAIAIAGVALLVVGILTSDAAVRDLGIGALGAAGIHVPTAIAASPGVVVPANGIEGATTKPDTPAGE